jgi:hypothetical protein
MDQFLHRPVKIGDVISLSVVRAHGSGGEDEFFLNGGGIMDDTVTFAGQWSEENLFQVCTRSYVTSAEEWKEWEEAHTDAEGVQGEFTDAEQKEHKAHRRVMAKEQERNRLNMKVAPPHHSPPSRLRVYGCSTPPPPIAHG